MDSGGKRSAKDSRCARGRAYPMQWIEYRDLSHPSSIEIASWIASLLQAVRFDVLAMIDERERAAARGELLEEELEPLKPVTRYQELWEIRWLVRVDRKWGGRRLIRQYHAEPVSEPDGLVRLHRHIKPEGDPEDVRPLQNAEMDHAKNRYDSGVASRWEQS